jgi:hypothetical protein
MMILGLGAAVFSCLYVLSFGYAQHSPQPHDVRIDVVAAPSVTEQVRHALDTNVSGGFDVRPVSTESTAREHLRHMTTSGALVLTPGGGVRVLTASAQGLPLQSAVYRALDGVALARGVPAQHVDVVPLPDRDRFGLTSFSLELGLLVPAVVGAIVIFVLGRRARLWIRLLGALMYAVVAAALAVLMLDTWLGALTGAPWALFGDAALIGATFFLSVVALHALFGLPGTAVAAGALLVVGNAVNGVAVPTSMLPDVYRQIAPAMPNNAAVHLVRSDVYFDGNDHGAPILTLVVWLVASFLIVTLTDAVQQRRRATLLARGGEIWGVPLVGLLRSGTRRTRRTAQHQAGPEGEVASAMVHVDAGGDTDPTPTDLDSRHGNEDRPTPAVPVRIEIRETARTPAVVVTVSDVASAAVEITGATAARRS